MRDDGIYLVPRLSSHGVAILAIYCLGDFFTGELRPTPDTLTRDLHKLSIPVSPKFERTVPAATGGV